MLEMTFVLEQDAQILQYITDAHISMESTKILET